LKTHISGQAPQVWRHWSNHFESTMKVTQLTEQVSVMQYYFWCHHL